MQALYPRPKRVGTHTSQVGTAIFCLVIAIHTFSQLFFRRQWSNRTCYIVLVVSWALLLLEVCIEIFGIAIPKKKGPYFGIAGLWCWITPAYPIPRYATSYLHMFISAGLSFILYLLVFFRLRGNITISAGHKISFQRRPKVRVGRTHNGAYIVTDDQRIESHLTRVAKHMLWYPVVFTVVVLPLASSRFSAFHGASVPFSVTISSAGLFMLHGFINTVLFCTTRNILPGSWRRRLGLGTALDSGRSDFNLSSRSITTWRFDARIGAGTEPVILSVGVEKDVEIMYDEAQRSPRCVKLYSSSLPLMPNRPPRVYDGDGQRSDAHRHYIQQPSFPPRIEMDRVGTTLE
jgi:hypothetical protein